MSDRVQFSKAPKSAETRRLAIRTAETDCYDQQPIRRRFQTSREDGHWVDVAFVGKGKFVIVGSNLVDKDEPMLALAGGNSRVRDLGEGSSEANCFGLTNRLQWCDVEFDFTHEGDGCDLFHGPLEYIIRAASFKRVSEALRRVAFCKWSSLSI